MSSGGWTLFPDEYMEEIDGQRIPMFGYRMEEREEDGFTTLDLYGIPVSEENVRYAREALLEFFYPENPLFGNEIESTDGYALYERSDLAVPCADAADIPGVLYYKYIARGRLPFPAVIHLTEKADHFESDRSRELLYDADIIEAVYKLTENLSPDASLWLLIRMEKYWNETPKFRKGHVADLHTWYYVICQLVRNVSVSGELVSLFVLKYPPGKYAYVERIGNDGERKRLIRESRSWFNEQNKGGRRRRLVNPIFRLFGIASVLDEYTEKKGMLYREPDGEEKSRSEMLKACAGVILSGWIPNAYMPEILIDTGSGVKGDSRSAYGGHEASFRTETRMERASSFEKRKYHIKYHVKTIVLEADDLSVHTTFQKTLLKYVDGCVRMYGMERSARSNAVLTYTGSLLYQARNVIAAYANRWNQVISEEIHGNESGE